MAGPAALAYGDVLLGSTGGPRSIVVTNQGDVPSGPIAAALGGVSAPQYQIDGGCQGLALGPGASCTVAVTFAPTLAGDASASVFFQAAPGDAAAVALSGRAVRPAHLVLNPTPERAFEDTLLRLRAAGSIEVLNDGDVATGPLAVSIGGATTEFGVDLDQCGGVALAPGQRCTVMVAFTPTIRGVSQGTFTVTGAPGGSASTGLRGRGLAPANLVASPGALAFVDQLVGTPSGPQAVAFTNDGDVASGGTQVSLSGPAAGRFQIALNGCNVLLQPQASCTVTVVFRPDAAGAAAAVLNATALPGGSLAIPLTGRGLAPAHLAVNPPARAFGDLLVGTTSAATTFTLVNDGDVASGPVNSGLGGVSAPQFQSSNGCQGRTLAPGASCTVSVTFAPTVAGDAAASLFFDATPGNPASASLSGRGLAPAHLTAAPPDLAFPDTLVGGSNTPVSIVVSNDGDVPSGVLAVTGGGGNFPIGSDGCSGQPLAAHSSCAVAVGFLPAAAGASAATVTITGAPGGSAAAHLSGRGLAPARLNVSPPSLAFGSQLVATTGAPSTVTFSNDGDVPTGTLAVALGGAGAGQYQISANGCAGGAIAAKGACTVTLVFAPTAAGSATATIAASGTPGGSASASLGGTGLAPAHLVIAPPAATFGDVLVGASSAPTTFTVTNDGDVASGPLLSGLGGVSGPQYHVESNGCEGVTLGPKASCSISVVLAPTAAGDASAGLFVNASPGGSALASLSGRGQAPAHLVIAPPGIVFPDQLIGGSSPETPVTVTNDGDVPAGALVTGLTGLAAAQFQIGANGCAGVPLAGHSSCTVGLIFRPTATGDSAASFTVTGAPGGTAATNLGGRGLKPASLAVTPQSFTFPDLPVGQESQPQVFTFSNGGDVPTGPLAVVTGGPGAPQYRIQNDGCSGLALPPHGSCTTAVTFAPTAPGDVPPAALAAAGNPGGSTSASLGARALGPAHLRIEPPELFFGSVPLDAVPPTMTFTVFNDGDEPSGLPDGFLEGPGAPFFDTPNLPPCAHAPLPPHGSCAVDMRFHPGAPGETSALLTVRATPGGDAFINLRGIGLESARLTVSPDQFDFGPVPLGQSRQTTFVVTNSGVNPAGTVGVSLEGPDVPEFAIVDDACTGRTLAPGETCPLTARFAPHQSGFRSVTLTVRGSESGGVASSLLRGSSGEGGGTCTPDSCGQGLLCCGSFCADPRFDQQNCGGCGNTCPAGQFCNNGICGCSPMQADCNGVCTFLQGDPDNCGACGNTCPPGNRFCGQGPAGPTCQSCTSANMVDCNNRCVDLRHDQQNCGACGQACAANQACIEGACVTGTCSLNCGPGSLCCEGGVEGGGQRCTDPRFDAFNCGGCGVVCGPNRFCNNGVCGCQPGQVDCNGVCTFLQGDPDNCGACGNTCPIGSRFCGGGTMPPPPGTTDPSKPGNSCQPCSVIGQTECGGRCVDIHSDQNNCGTCGSACGPNQGCVNGTCVTGTCATSCGPGSICCTSPPTGTEPGRDLCVSPNFDQNNCGACGNVCGGGRFCQNGVCACNPMQVDCNGACTNVFGDPDNCGSCGHVCPAGSRYCSGFVREGEPCQPCSAAGQTECGGRCVDTQNDQGNCGACGVACAPNQACVAGACVSGTCAFTCGPGAVCCQGGAPGTPDGGQKCSDLRFDQTNCGGCGIVCGPNHFCNNGVCGCQPGLVECNGACTYPFGGDPDNCGACGTICPEGSRLCGYGPAGLGCYACDLVGQSECNGRCVDMQTDSSNCGACGNPCGPNQACVAGACVSGTCALSCGPGALCCSIPPSGPEPARDSCVPPLYDPSNCGGCGIVCGSGKFCQNGACTCPGGQIDCQGVCAFVGGGDPDHCGSCQTVCPPGNRFCGPGPAGTTPSCQPCASSGQTECNGRCADTHTDQANCGACGQSCAPGQACVDGACISGSCALSCPGGWICCGPPDRPFCSDPHYDYGNCGACGNVCGPGQFCNNGQCSCGSAGLTNCNGVCRDLRYDPDSCGTCGNVCPPEARFCVADPNPTCRPCPGPGQALCDGRCTDTRSDRDNCGACGTGCGDGNSCLNSACVAGTCSISCGQGSICCGSETGGQFCVGPGYDRNNCGGCGIVCPDTQSCISGVCGCQSYEASCGGSCTYLPSDANNCGACGNVCPAGSRFCNGGRCQPCSVIGQSECDGRCLDLQNDAANCGACGNACGANQACVSGRCIEGTCPISCGQGAICCGSEATGQFCAGPGYDRNNCGGCGIVCPDTQSCISGTCGCQSYEASCDGTCSYLPSDPHNCGACGHLCPAGSPFCSGGQCQPCSAIGQSECNGRCIDLPNDPANCGACGNACGANQACAGGRCIEGTCPINCGQGAICCGSEATGQFCAGPGYDRNNCGGCGIACADTQSCISGTCGCQSYEASCSGVCSYLPNDANNCGACGHVCPEGSRFCSGGQCQSCASIDQTECNGRCVDSRNDPANCGTCGTTCQPNQACVNSACVGGL